MTDSTISRPFGYSLTLDLYECQDGVCDSLEAHYRFLEKLVSVLDMKPLCQPIVLHCPQDFEKDENGLWVGKSRFPDKDGVSGWVGLATSGIQIHSVEPTHYTAIDCFSCLCFDKEVIIEEARKVFRFRSYEESWVERGLKYSDYEA